MANRLDARGVEKEGAVAESGAHTLKARATINRGLLRRLSWALARLRAGQKLTAADLARAFEMSVRNAYRDLDVLRDDWRVPLEFDRAGGTFRLTEPAGLVAPVTITRGESVALFFAEKVLRLYRGTPFEADLAAAFAKIRDMLPEEISISPDALEGALSLDIGPVHLPDAAHFADLLTALQLRRTALVRYTSLHSARTTDRRLRPYHVFNHRGDWYVAAWDERRRSVRDFALHRIRRIALTTDGYDIPADFDARSYFGAAFAIEKDGRPTEVAIRFGPRQARWIRERRWHRTARIEERLDGGCVLRLRVAGLGEVQRWVMQFGSEAEVLRPASLRRRVASDLGAALARYRRT
jgi:predicted DNA-binding transcriptional regulator YafY